jgi:hypothetical protein
MNNYHMTIQLKFYRQGFHELQKNKPSIVASSGSGLAKYLVSRSQKLARSKSDF